jgi:hypothetical protein
VIVDRPRLNPDEKPRLTTRAKIVILSSLVPVVIGVAILPFILLAVPDPHPVRVPSLTGEIAGTYVVRQDGLYKLYPYTAPAMSFPSDALVVDDPLPQVIVKFRQLDLLSLYGISRYGDSQGIAVQKTVDQAGKALYLRPQTALGSGDYVIVAARDGADAGEDYFYFRVP